MSDDIKDEEIEAVLAKNPMTASGEYQKMNIRLLRGIYRSLNPSMLEQPAKPEPKQKKLRG